MKEENVSIEHDGIRLDGTWATPNDTPPYQCVLLIASAGPLDRNQNSNKVQLNIFNEVAQALAEAGIASLRYDKRGCGSSSGNFDASGHVELVSDASQWITYLLTRPETENIPLYVLGHGEGALIASQLATKHSSIAGQIFLAPSVENYADTIQRQTQKALQEIDALPGIKGKLIRFMIKIGGNQLRKQKKLLERIKKSKKPTLKIKKQVINAKWIREMMALDALAIFTEPNVPTLAIAGSKDLQSLATDIETIRAVTQGPFEAHIIQDMTHILRADSQEPSTQHYMMLSVQPVDERLLTTLTDWLSR